MSASASRLVPSIAACPANISCSRLLDLLTDINNRPQIPPEKRIDVSLDIPSDAEEGFILGIDREPRPGPRPAKALKDLIKETPHLDFAAACDRMPEVADNIVTGLDSPAADPTSQKHPPSFLTADDIDNYLWEVDMQAKAEAEERGEDVEMLPTLAPLARESGAGSHGAATRGATPSSAPANIKDTSAAGASSISTTSRDFALRNPVSVYNWLRKNAPKTFLQDNETGEDKKERGHSGEKQSRKAHRPVDDDDDDDETRTPAKKTTGAGRKASGEGGRASLGSARIKGERAPKAERAPKRSKATSGKVKRQSMDETMYDLDDELGVQAANARASATKGKRKRVAVDDDTGYRPKGGSSRRPTKRRNKNNSVSLASAGGAGPDDSIEASGKADTPLGKKAARMRDEADALETESVDAEAEME